MDCPLLDKLCNYIILHHIFSKNSFIMATNQKIHTDFQ